MFNSRPILRIKEKYLLLAIIIVFMIISLIGMAYLPDLKVTSKVYLNYLKKPSSSYDSLGPQLLGLIPPNDINDDDNQLQRQQSYTGILPPPPRGRLDDARRLQEKIQKHLQTYNNNSQLNAVIPVPELNQNSNQPQPKHQYQSYDVNHNNNQSIFETIRRQSTNWTRIILPNGDDFDREIRKKRNKIKEMMIIAWDNYRKYAWGENELKPISKKGHQPGVFGKTKLGATIVDGMDTLYIMGLMDRFEDGRQWIAENLDFSQINSDISVFETIIRFVGGLLTCYAFTKDEMFLHKAINITNLMLPAFDTQTGIPHALIKPLTGKHHNYLWAPQSTSILSEIGTLSLEFNYLTVLTGNRIYYDKVDRIQTILDSLSKPDGLYPNYINPKTGKFGQKHVSIGALGDSFYEYLLKFWLISDKKDTTSLRMYNEAVDAIDKKLVKKSKSGLSYIADLRYERLEHKMGHLACFSAGMFALGAKEMAHDQHRCDHYLELAKNIAETCHESYIRTKTQIGPEVFWFTGQYDAQSGKKKERYYILRPEVIEGWFYLWRLTKDHRYRQWAWDATLAIEKYCLTADRTGFTGIADVDVESKHIQQDDVQQSFFLAETLKYLYLIFSQDDLISFNEWVFNSEGHPLPIKNHNPAYPS